MTQKRILRANTRNVARERDKMLRNAFALAAADVENPDAVELVVRLTEESPDDTALELFGMVNQLVDELVEVTGDDRAVVIRRLRNR